MSSLNTELHQWLKLPMEPLDYSGDIEAAWFLFHFLEKLGYKMTLTNNYMVGPRWICHISGKEHLEVFENTAPMAVAIASQKLFWRIRANKNG